MYHIGAMRRQLNGLGREPVCLFCLTQLHETFGAKIGGAASILEEARFFKLRYCIPKKVGCLVEPSFPQPQLTLPHDFSTTEHHHYSRNLLDAKGQILEIIL
jgi:hypothetical protein